MKPVINPIVFTLIDNSRPLGETIAKAITASHRHLAGDVTKTIASSFRQGHPIVAIMASGIVLRAIGPYLDDKHSDAPVIAVSPDGGHIVPLVGGHHGANQLAREIAKVTGGIAAITTASDNRFNVSLDEPPEGYVLANPQDFKPFMASALAGTKITLNTPVTWLTDSNLPLTAIPAPPSVIPAPPSVIPAPPSVIPAKAGTQKPILNKTETGFLSSRLRGNDEGGHGNDGGGDGNDDEGLQITITDTNHPGDKSHLIYHPKTLTIGVGCERGADPLELITLIEQCLTTANLSKSSVSCLTSIDLKSDEHAINQAAKILNVPVRLFTTEQLNQQAARLQNPSDIVMAEVGCPGVAEGAALAAAQENGELIVAKTKSVRATCAIARSPAPIIDQPGHARGKLSVIGIGPGSDEWRSPQATSELINASDWVGYDLYLDLVANLKTSQTEHRFNLGKEEARVRHAFKLAGKGRDVALVCSGDAAIYAMAALVFEVLDSDTLCPAEQRVEIKTLPGISAFQAASARAGALIGHDFCTISLSDLLTPWATIEQRLHAAAQGDFNIAFYNPRSLKRTDQLQKAIDILTAHRHPDTPVIIASNLGRPSETTKTVRFADFNPEEVDMLTIVLIGSSQSKIIARGDGQSYCYTPRGYANKKDHQKAQTS